MSNASLSHEVKQYMAVTGNYWAFTLTDGALRMLVVLFFHQLGYSPIEIAMLFLFYEFFGVITNLIGGWLGAKLGLNTTMNIGLALQVGALLMLAVPAEWLNVAYVMLAQALSGIAKDLNKMSAKSSIKSLVNKDEQSQLYKWVALLTGSKNALKGIGFFLGGLLLSLFGFAHSMMLMAAVLFCVWCFSFFYLKEGMGKAKNKPKFSQLFSKSADLNYLSFARLCLFASRDVWFVVALPVYLVSQLNWSSAMSGGFMACWIIAYGIVQSAAPKITESRKDTLSRSKKASNWAYLLAIIPFCIALGLFQLTDHQWVLIIGLTIYGIVFAINSSLHSYLIVSMSDEDSVSLDVGFYYMANAMGRLIGTILSGWVYQEFGLISCLIISGILVLLSAIFVRFISSGKNVST